MFTFLFCISHWIMKPYPKIHLLLKCTLLERGEGGGRGFANRSLGKQWGRVAIKYKYSFSLTGCHRIMSEPFLYTFHSSVQFTDYSLPSRLFKWYELNITMYERKTEILRYILLLKLFFMVMNLTNK